MRGGHHDSKAHVVGRPQTAVPHKATYDRDIARPARRQVGSGRAPARADPRRGRLPAFSAGPTPRQPTPARPGIVTFHRKPPQGTPAFKPEGHAEQRPATMNTVSFLASTRGKWHTYPRSGAAALPGGKPDRAQRDRGIAQMGSAAQACGRESDASSRHVGATVLLRGTPARMGPAVRNQGNSHGGLRSFRLWPGESSPSGKRAVGIEESGIHEVGLGQQIACLERGMDDRGGGTIGGGAGGGRHIGDQMRV
jgi:hypothetical protein